MGINVKEGNPLSTYLYDTIIFDSDIEERNIQTKVESVEVFGKIPKRSIKIPFIDGSTYSPDFMYVVKDERGRPSLNVVIESKGVKSQQDLRTSETDKIDSAQKLFKIFEQEGIEVHYHRQTNNEDVLSIINKIINTHSHV